MCILNIVYMGRIILPDPPQKAYATRYLLFSDIFIIFLVQSFRALFLKITLFAFAIMD